MKTKHSDKIKIGIIGANAGISLSSYIPAIQNCSDFVLSSVLDIDETKITYLANELSCNAFTNLDEFLVSDIDAVAITSPDQFHQEHVIASANAGKHILCTKPLGLNLQEAKGMQDAVNANNVLFMPGMNMRFCNWSQQIKEALDTGEIGTPMFIRWHYRGDFYPYPEGHFYRKTESGGQLIHNGAHFFDCMSYWAESLPVSINGVSTRNFPNEIMEWDNYHNLSLRFESGAIGHLEYNQTLVNPRGYPAVTMIMIVGTEGLLEIGIDDLHALEIYQEGKLSYKATNYYPVDNSGFNLLLSTFCEAVRKQQASPIPVENAVRILETCLAGSASCAEMKKFNLGI